MIERHTITDRNRWLFEWRPRYLGASEVAAAAGFDPFKSRLQLYAEKSGLVMPQGETPAMRRGRLLEGAAIEYLQEERPDWRIVRPGVFLCDSESGLSCTPDALAEDPEDPGALVNVQVKVVSRQSFEKWDGTAPLGYQLQVTSENMLLDADRGVLAVLVMGSFDADLHLFDIRRHDGAERKIREIARDFWDDIAAGRMPRADYRRDAGTLAEIFPPNGEVPVPLDLSSDNRIQELLEERADFKMAEKLAHEAAEALDAELVEKLAGAEIALAPGWKITRKMQHRDERLVKASDFPVLRIARTKEQAA